jgi:hypothetical protein
VISLFDCFVLGRARAGQGAAILSADILIQGLI